MIAFVSRQCPPQIRKSTIVFLVRSLTDMRVESLLSLLPSAPPPHQPPAPNLSSCAVPAISASPPKSDVMGISLEVAVSDVSNGNSPANIASQEWERWLAGGGNDRSKMQSVL